MWEIKKGKSYEGGNRRSAFSPLISEFLSSGKRYSTSETKNRYYIWTPPITTPKPATWHRVICLSKNGVLRGGEEEEEESITAQKEISGHARKFFFWASLDAFWEERIFFAKIPFLGDGKRLTFCFCPKRLSRNRPPPPPQRKSEAKLKRLSFSLSVSSYIQRASLKKKILFCFSLLLGKWMHFCNLSTNYNIIITTIIQKRFLPGF